MCVLGEKMKMEVVTKRSQVGQIIITEKKCISKKKHKMKLPNSFFFFSKYAFLSSIRLFVQLVVP